MKTVEEIPLPPIFVVHLLQTNVYVLILSIILTTSIPCSNLPELSNTAVWLTCWNRPNISFFSSSVFSLSSSSRFTSSINFVFLWCIESISFSNDCFSFSNDRIYKMWNFTTKMVLSWFCRKLLHTSQCNLQQSFRCSFNFWFVRQVYSKVLLNNLVFFLIFFLQYNWLQSDKTKNKWKINYKEITKNETTKYSTSTYLTALSNRTVKKESGGGERRGEKNEYIFKAKERNNIKSMVLKIYF